MADIYHNILTAAAAMSIWEVAAVGFGVAYLALAMRQNNLCWYAAFIGTAISIGVFWDVSLLMESALNGYYLIMAVYGWWAWRQGVEAKPLPIQRWGWRQHSLVIGLVVLLTLISGYWLENYTQAALPYLDSFTTWGAVITTWMVARKVLDNWLYWLVVDAAAAYMYILKDLYLFAGLMLVYLVMVIFGWISWHKEYKEQAHELQTA